MKNKNFKRLFLVLIATFLIFNLFSICAFATEESGEESYVDWELSEDERYLYNLTDKKDYFYYIPGTKLDIAADFIYVYAEDIYFSWSFYTLCPEKSLDYPEIVWVEGYDGERLFYVTNRGYNYVDSFIGGEIGDFRLKMDSFMYSDMTVSFVEALDEDMRGYHESYRIDVTELRNYEFYVIEAIDEFHVLSYEYGAIYLIDGEYYYLNYRELDNSYFDADGNFSYRSGRVELHKVFDERASVINNYLNNAEYIYCEYEYENADEYGYYDVDLTVISLIFFWLGYIVVGFIAPLPFIIIGFSLAFIKKLGRPVYWIGVSLLGILWEIVAIVLAILIILVLLI